MSDYVDGHKELGAQTMNDLIRRVDDLIGKIEINDRVDVASPAILCWSSLPVGLLGSALGLFIIIAPIVGAIVNIRSWGDIPNAVGLSVCSCLFGLPFAMMGLGNLAGSALLRNCYVRAGPSGISFRVTGFFLFPFRRGNLSWDQVKSLKPYVQRSTLIFMGILDCGLDVNTHDGKCLFIRTMAFWDDPQTIADNIERASRQPLRE